VRKTELVTIAVNGQEVVMPATFVAALFDAYDAWLAEGQQSLGARRSLHHPKRGRVGTIRWIAK
jgi:hypothetical protein